MTISEVSATVNSQAKFIGSGLFRISTTHCRCDLRKTRLSLVSLKSDSPYSPELLQMAGSVSR